MTVLVGFETHSWSADNENGVASGWGRCALSPRGRELAAELGARHRTAGLAAVLTSDLPRATETVAIAFGGTDVPVVADARLRECDYGELTEAPAATVLADRRARLHVPYPGGESWTGAVARVGSVLPGLRERYAGRRVLVIGHVATRWALDHLVDGVPLEALVEADFGWRPGWEYVL